jgi:hypothetical protein
MFKTNLVLFIQTWILFFYTFFKPNLVDMFFLKKRHLNVGALKMPLVLTLLFSVQYNL